MSGERKSFQVPLNTKTVHAINAGFASGMMIRQKMPKLEQPSIRAASSRSGGIDMKNCRSKNVMNGPPKNCGTISGTNVSIQPSCRQSTNCGMSVTCGGSISV